jgi:hypothetical protein
MRKLLYFILLALISIPVVLFGFNTAKAGEIEYSSPSYGCGASKPDVWFVDKKTGSVG